MADNMRSAVEIEQYLTDIDYPASKDELVEYAQSADAPVDVVATLDQLPDREYNSFEEVSQQLGTNSGIDSIDTE